MTDEISWLRRPDAVSTSMDYTLWTVLTSIYRLVKVGTTDTLYSPVNCLVLSTCCRRGEGWF